MSSQGRYRRVVPDKEGEGVSEGFADDRSMSRRTEGVCPDGRRSGWLTGREAARVFQLFERELTFK